MAQLPVASSGPATVASPAEASMTAFAPVKVTRAPKATDRLATEKIPILGKGKRPPDGVTTRKPMPATTPGPMARLYPPMTCPVSVLNVVLLEIVIAAKPAGVKSEDATPGSAGARCAQWGVGMGLQATGQAMVSNPLPSARHFSTEPLSSEQRSIEPAGSQASGNARSATGLPPSLARPVTWN
jgi:hypothetical protein